MLFLEKIVQRNLQTLKLMQTVIAISSKIMYNKIMIYMLNNKIF